MDYRSEQEPRVGGQPEGRTLEAEERLVHGLYLGPAGTTVGVTMTIISCESALSSRLLNSQPSTGMRPRSGTSRSVLVSLSVRTPPMTSRSPSRTMTSFSDRRLKIGGLPCTACAKFGSLFSTSTFIRIRVTSA